MRFQLTLRLGTADVGQRVVIRWLRPGPAEAGTPAPAGTLTPLSTSSGTTGPDRVTDVLGILESAGPDAFTVRRDNRELVTIPRNRILGGKPVPPRRARPARPPRPAR